MNHFANISRAQQTLTITIKPKEFQLKGKIRKEFIFKLFIYMFEFEVIFIQKNKIGTKLIDFH